MNTNTKLIGIALMSIALSSASKAGSVGFYDSAFVMKDGATTITSTSPIDALFGTYSGSVFTPYITSVGAGNPNSGYVDTTPAAVEFAVNLSQNNNTLVTAGTQMYICISDRAGGSNYVSATKEVVLTDPSWLVPSFTVGTPSGLTYYFSASTTAVKGSFTFASGAEGAGIDTISFVPEPSTYAAIGGMAVLGVALLRRRKSSATA